ncbi:tyrosine-protein kinase receptor Tie-1-like [Glandiceps talaboti]
MAIESLLDSVYTMKSDVWSYGVVLWEIVTLGASPYSAMSSKEVIRFLQSGARMPKPRHCSDAIYDIMKECWCECIQDRPSFSNICLNVGRIVQDTNKEYLTMKEFEDHLYVNIPENLWPPGEKL